MLARTILVVDDSSLLHRMYDVLLQGHRLIHAGDGLQALERLSDHPEIELVLLDINMPNLDGLSVLAQIRENPVTADLPVIMVSTLGREADTERAMLAGADGYIKKPFAKTTIRELLQSIEREHAR